MPLVLQFRHELHWNRAQDGPGLFDADGFSPGSNVTAPATSRAQFTPKDGMEEGCLECRWRTPEEARAARARRRAYEGTLTWVAGSAATAAVWLVGGYLVLKAL